MRVSNTADRLREIMNTRGLRQSDIVRMAQPFCKEHGAKLSKSDMSQFVSGKVEPGQTKLFILGKTLRVSEAWLIGYDVDMEPEEDIRPTNDVELAEYLETLRTRPECRMLFSLAKDATKADVEKAVAIIEALRGVGDK